jgi:predicted nucleic acid-binding protein
VKLLADTGALLALFNPRDRLHRQARQFVERAQGARFVLTELVVSETVTRLRSRLDAGRAADVGAALLQSRRYEVIFVDARLMEAGLGELRRFADKRLSLADAVSFAVIRELSLDGAFAFDRDFRDCGFAMHPDAGS